MRHARCARTRCSEPSREHSKYCSDFCRYTHANETRPKVPRTAKKCVVCGTRFIARADAKCCSSTCRSRLQRQREQASAA